MTLKKIATAYLITYPLFVQGLFLQPKDGACASINGEVKSITLGKNSRDIGVCVNKCLNDRECVGMQFTEPKECKLYYGQIKKIVNAPDGTYCGRITSTCSDSSSFVFGTYEYEGSVQNQDCAWLTAENQESQARKERWCDETINGFPVDVMCPVSCDFCPLFIDPELPKDCEDSSTYVFGTYEYKQTTTVRDCAWLTANEKKADIRKSQWCDKLVDGFVVKEMCQHSCDVCAAIPNKPTEPPEANDSCTFQADLGFPFTDPDDAPYYGYSADQMSIKMADDDYWECSWRYSESLPGWCTYNNSDPNGDSAYVANIDDKYWDDSWEELSAETIVVKGAAGNTYNILVSHYFFEKDYYTELDSWNDHMLAPVLKVKNLSNPDQGQLKRKGWSRPVDVDTPTHLQNDNGDWVPNPDFIDKFQVTVSCSENCICEASYKLV